jgi:MFS transporter, DHA1 family, inner membrane transport protein
MSVAGKIRPQASATWEISILVLGAAVVVAVEFMVIGLTPFIAQTMKLSAQQASGLVTCFALGSAAMGPLAAIISRRIRTDLAMTLALLPFAANIIVPILREPLLLYLLRTAQGATLPLFIGVASEALSRILGRDAKAIGLIYLGVTIGGLLGVPGGVALAQAMGWYSPFILLGGLAGGVAFTINRLPRLRLHASSQGQTGSQIALAIQPKMLAHLFLSLLQFSAMFSMYAFLGTILTEAGQGGAAMPYWLLLFGVAGVAGNVLAGHFTGNFLGASTIITAALIALTGLVLHAVPLAPIALFLLLAIWGAAHAAAFVVSQTRVTRVAPQVPRLAAALNISAANLGIALGTAIGGWTLSVNGLDGLALAGIGLGMLSLGLAGAIGDGQCSSCLRAQKTQPETLPTQTNKIKQRLLTAST